MNSILSPYVLIILAGALILRPMFRSSALFRSQSLIVLAGILTLWIGNLLYVLHLNPFGDLNLTPLVLGLTGILLAVGMFGWCLFDIKPVALAARLFAVVDVWDSLTSDRPYRKAWAENEACQFILDNSGKQFDPQVVKKFFLERG